MRLSQFGLQLLREADGILIPGGFGVRGIEGKIETIRYTREKGIPFLGLCLGMQCAVIEFARQTIGTGDANSTEFDMFTEHPVIDFMPDQREVEDKGGTMRLGLYPCELQKGSQAAEAYNTDQVDERHRHRFEFNNAYREKFQKAGFVFSGLSPDGKLVEVIELANHPFFMASQFHPEFTSNPRNGHPLFISFIKAALAHKGAGNQRKAA